MHSKISSEICCLSLAWFRYLNNIPVDVMRGLGVDTVIVVDVEDKDASVWRNLSAYDGGISGWRLLWDRWCPIPSLRCSLLGPCFS